MGKALLLKTIEGCRGRFEVITLEVFSNNLAAKKLYEKVGFKTYGVLPGGVKRGGNSVTAVIRFCLDYRAIFKGKSHNCCL